MCTVRKGRDWEEVRETCEMVRYRKSTPSHVMNSPLLAPGSQTTKAVLDRAGPTRCPCRCGPSAAPPSSVGGRACDDLTAVGHPHACEVRIVLRLVDRSVDKPARGGSLGGSHDAPHGRSGRRWALHEAQPRLLQTELIRLCSSAMGSSMSLANARWFCTATLRGRHYKRE